MIDGHTLIGWGFKPGPAFKTILNRLNDPRLAGDLSPFWRKNKA